MLAKLLGVRPEDRRTTFVAFATLAAMLMAHAMLETARDALFLEKLPPSRLPLAYLAIAGSAWFVSKAQQRLTAWVPARGRLAGSLLLGGAITASFHQTLATPTPLTLGLLYVWTGTLATVVVLQFWLLLGDLLDVGQAKRLFALIGSGGLLGATLGAALSGATLAQFNGEARPLLLGAGGLFAVAALVSLGIGQTPVVSAPKRTPATPQRGGAWAMVRDDRYLRRLLASVLIAAVLVTGVDYVFKARVVEAAQAGQLSLGSFFARYYTVVSGLSLLVQLAIAPRLLRAVGVNRALLVLPGVMLLGTIGFVLTLGLVPAMLLKGSDGMLRHSLHRTSSEILYLPLQRRVRERFSGLAASLGQRGGQAIASLAILAATRLEARLEHIAVALVALAAGWVASLLGLQPLYLELFRKQLRDGALSTDVEVPDLDLASYDALVSALSSESDEEVLAALGMFEDYGKVASIPALILYHPSRDVVLRAFEIFARHERGDVRRLTGRLLNHEDAEIRAAALRTVSSWGPDEEQLRAALEDGSATVRVTALVGLIGAGFAGAEEAEEALTGAVHGPCHDTRMALARSLPRLPPDFFEEVAADLLASERVEVQETVAEAIAKQPRPRFAPALVELLDHRTTRTAAREALLAIGEPALDVLARRLADKRSSQRLHLPRTISRFPGERPAKLLVEALAREKDDRVCLKILRGLGRLRATNPTLPIDEERVLAVAAETLKRAIRVLHLRHGLEVLLDDGRGVEATPTTELLVALLGDLENQAIERLFRAFHVLAPTQDFAIIYAGLQKGDRKARASGRELLSHVVPAEMRDGVMAMLDDRDAAARLHEARSFHEPPHFQRVRGASKALRDGAEDAQTLAREACVALLRTMLADPKPALRSLAAYNAAEMGLHDLEPDLERARGEVSSLFGEVAEGALSLLHAARGGAPA